MKSRRPFALLLVLAMVASLFSVAPAQAGSKRRIAVMPFEYGAVSSEVGTLDVGKGIVSLLITRLVNDGTYSVVDRQMLAGKIDRGERCPGNQNCEGQELPGREGAG